MSGWFGYLGRSVDGCRCDACRGLRIGDEGCNCGHPFAAHDATRWHSCNRCVWCDEYRIQVGQWPS